MSIAEQKVALVKLIVEADEEAIGKLTDFAEEMNRPDQKFTDAELAKFHATRKKYLSDTNNTILLEDAHTYIRSLKQK